MIDPSVRDVLRDVYDPCCRDKGISVVDMGLLHRAEIDDGAARVELMLTSGWCPFATTVLGDIETAVRTLPGVDTATVELVWHEAWAPERLSDSARAKLLYQRVEDALMALPGTAGVASSMVPLLARVIADYEENVGPITAPGFDSFGKE